MKARCRSGIVIQDIPKYNYNSFETTRARRIKKNSSTVTPITDKPKDPLPHPPEKLPHPRKVRTSSRPPPGRHAETRKSTPRTCIIQTVRKAGLVRGNATCFGRAARVCSRGGCPPRLQPSLSLSLAGKSSGGLIMPGQRARSLRLILDDGNGHLQRPAPDTRRNRGHERCAPTVCT